MQTLQATGITIDVGLIVSVFIGIISSYAFFVIRSLRRETDRERENFRDYKRDVAVTLQELIENKNSLSERVSVLETIIERRKAKRE